MIGIDERVGCGNGWNQIRIVGSGANERLRIGDGGGIWRGRLRAAHVSGRWRLRGGSGRIGGRCEACRRGGRRRGRGRLQLGLEEDLLREFLVLFRQGIVLKTRALRLLRSGAYFGLERIWSERRGACRPGK